MSERQANKQTDRQTERLSSLIIRTKVVKNVNRISETQRPPGVKIINNLTCVKNKVDQNHPPIFVNLK